MSKSSRYVIGVVAALALSTGSLHAQKNAQKTSDPPALDAEIETTFTTSTGSYSTPGHFYRSQDGTMREDSPVGSMITDVRRGTVTLLNPATKEAKVIVIAGQPQSSKHEPAANAFVPFEEAAVEGHSVTKARAKGIAGQTQEMWTARDLGLVVFSKVDWPDFKMTKVLRKVSLHEPDPEVFKIPKDYTVTHETVRPTPPKPDHEPRWPSRPPSEPRR